MSITSTKNSKNFIKIILGLTTIVGMSLYFGIPKKMNLEYSSQFIQELEKYEKRHNGEKIYYFKDYWITIKNKYDVKNFKIKNKEVFVSAYYDTLEKNKGFEYEKNKGIVYEINVFENKKLNYQIILIDKYKDNKVEGVYTRKKSDIDVKNYHFYKADENVKKLANLYMKQYYNILKNKIIKIHEKRNNEIKELIECLD